VCSISASDLCVCTQLESLWIDLADLEGSETEGNEVNCSRIAKESPLYEKLGEHQAPLCSEHQAQHGLSKQREDLVHSQMQCPETEISQLQWHQQQGRQQQDATETDNEDKAVGRELLWTENATATICSKRKIPAQSQHRGGSYEEIGTIQAGAGLQTRQIGDGDHRCWEGRLCSQQSDNKPSQEFSQELNHLDHLDGAHSSDDNWRGGDIYENYRQAKVQNHSIEWGSRDERRQSEQHSSDRQSKSEHDQDCHLQQLGTLGHSKAALDSRQPWRPTPCDSSTAVSEDMSARAVGCGTQLSNARQRRNTLRKGKVGFNTVEIRECRPLLGGGGGIPTAGSPLGMGWEVERQTRIDVDCFESWRDGGEGGQVRRPREVFMEYGYVAPEEREQRLLEAGHVQSELDRSEFEIRIINRRRERSSYIPFGEEY